ncbi:MAG TPA: 2-oxo-4-hydroxy-4-carboxy-5-ureidoimidazoline decarboxylase [Bauldia sp.]|nr:2-oxo-4-hydroxy-4-carboxy-5-ureidoimidazoline decarboxylase [Bauldia sp.]
MSGPGAFPIPLADVNAMSEDEFVDAFGDIAEHSPWVAADASEARPFASRHAMIAAFERAIRHADHARQRALILAHPDLAGRAAVAGDLTADSRKEQAGAGLNALTPAEFARFTKLNQAYRDRFGFPFIFAVRGATKHDILAGFEARIANSEKEEFATALAQVARIVRFRLEDRVAP